MLSVTQLWPTLFNPLDYSPPSSSVGGIFPGKNNGVVCHFLLQVYIDIWCNVKRAILAGD